MAALIASNSQRARRRPASGVEHLGQQQQHMAIMLDTLLVARPYARSIYIHCRFKRKIDHEPCHRRAGSTFRICCANAPLLRADRLDAKAAQDLGRSAPLW